MPLLFKTFHVSRLVVAPLTSIFIEELWTNPSHLSHFSKQHNTLHVALPVPKLCIEEVNSHKSFCTSLSTLPGQSQQELQVRPLDSVKLPFSDKHSLVYVDAMQKTKQTNKRNEGKQKRFQPRVGIEHRGEGTLRSTGQINSSAVRAPLLSDSQATTSAQVMCPLRSREEVAQ